MDRFPTKANSLAHLKAFFHDEIQSIIDVGVLTSTIELMRVFKNSKHVLIEPIPEFYETIEFNYSKANIDYDLLKIALSNQKGVQKIEKKIHLPELGEKYNVTASNLIFDDSTEVPDKNIIEVKIDTLDNILVGYGGPFLIKIDVDGAEFEILEGMTNYSDVYIVVVECWLRRISEFVRVLDEKGFQLWDITDLCYMRGQLSQVDLIFINKDVLYKEKYKELTPRKFGFTSGQKGNYFALKESIIDDEQKAKALQRISVTGNLCQGSKC